MKEREIRSKWAWVMRMYLSCHPLQCSTILSASPPGSTIRHSDKQCRNRLGGEWKGAVSLEDTFCFRIPKDDTVALEGANRNARNDWLVVVVACQPFRMIMGTAFLHLVGSQLFCVLICCINVFFFCIFVP